MRSISARCARAAGSKRKQLSTRSAIGSTVTWPDAAPRHAPCRCTGDVGAVPEHRVLNAAAKRTAIEQLHDLQGRVDLPDVDVVLARDPAHERRRPLPASSFRLPASSFRLPASSFQLPAFGFQLEDWRLTTIAR